MSFRDPPPHGHTPAKSNQTQITWDRLTAYRWILAMAHQRQGRVPTATLRGKFVRPDWSLIYKYSAGLESARIQADGSFEMTIYPESAHTSITLKAIGPLGEIETTEATFVIHNWNQLERAWHEPPPKAFGFTPSLGITSVSYSQTESDDYSGILLTGKLAYGKSFDRSPWSLSANAFASLLPLQSNQSEVRVRFVGLNARIGYVLPFPSRVWKASLMAGAYFSTMFVSESVFGYKNVSGPQLYPTLQRYFNNGDIGSAYLKYSPISNAFGFLNLSNRELAAGIGWLHSFGPRKLLLNLDLAHLRFLLNGTEIQNRSTTLSIGVGF